MGSAMPKSRKVFSLAAVRRDWLTAGCLGDCRLKGRAACGARLDRFLRVSRWVIVHGGRNTYSGLPPLIGPAAARHELPGTYLP